MQAPSRVEDPDRLGSLWILSSGLGPLVPKRYGATGVGVPWSTSEFRVKAVLSTAVPSVGSSNHKVISQ